MKLSPADSSAQRAADWMVVQMQPDGSLRGATSINEYYKTLFALVAAGRIPAAERMLHYVAGRFLKPDGDLDGRGCVWFEQFRIYPHAWVAMTAIQLARFDIAEPILRFLETFQDPRAGGFYGTLEQREKQGEQEMMTTGLVGLALLWGGRLEAAQRVAQWMKSLWEAQPNLERGLYAVWHSRQGLVTQFPRETADHYWVDASALAQRYFQYGVAAAFLASYAGVAQEPAWLKLGRDYLHASRFCREDVYLRPQSGKVGWGAAWTYRVKGDAQDRVIIEKVFAYLQSTQSAEGWWPQQAVYGAKLGEIQPLPSLDLTAEFMAHQAWMESALALR